MWELGIELPCDAPKKAGISLPRALGLRRRTEDVDRFAQLFQDEFGILHAGCRVASLAQGIQNGAERWITLTQPNPKERKVFRHLASQGDKGVAYEAVLGHPPGDQAPGRSERT